MPVSPQYINIAHVIESFYFIDCVLRGGGGFDLGIADFELGRVQFAQVEEIAEMSSDTFFNIQ